MKTMKTIMNFPTMIKKIKLFGWLLILLSAGPVSTFSSASDAIQRELLIFDGTPNPNWPFWDCCGETTPVVVQDEDPDHGASIEFTVVGETVLGFHDLNSLMRQSNLMLVALWLMVSFSLILK
jgi:hypothetical protein